MLEVAQTTLRRGTAAILRGLVFARDFVKRWWQPQRRAAFVALIKASALLGALSELGWLLNTHYFSRRFPQLPISLAWSMLSMIFLITWMQVGCSVALKLKSGRSKRLSAEVNRRLTASLAGYVSGENRHEELKRAAVDSPHEFESSVAVVLLGLRGSALQRLCDLPEVIELRRKWIEKSRTGDDEGRRHALEQLGLLRDAALIPTLEHALEDSVAGVVASAVRGLLQMGSYRGRDELIRSLPNRSYLVRVLTACETPDDVARVGASAATADIAALARACGHEGGGADLRPIPIAHDGDYTQTRPTKRQMRTAAMEVAAHLRVARAIPSIELRPREYESADAVREGCSALAALGPRGHDLLRLMSAEGEAGEAPAEALGESLAAVARGGRA
jgi:hypothetical protein